MSWIVWPKLGRSKKGRPGPARHGRAIRLRLDHAEQLATLTGATVSVSRDGETLGEISAKSPILDIARGDENLLRFSFVGPHGEQTDVSWSQKLAADQGDLIVVQPWRAEKSDPPRHVIAWSIETGRDQVVARLQKTAGVSVLSPIWWTIDRSGDIEASVDPQLVQSLRSRKVAVWPVVHGLHADGLRIALADETRRRALAMRISQDAKASGADGVNIDLEGYRSADSKAVTAFVELLADFVHGWGGLVSCDVVARSDSWELGPQALAFWSSAPQRRRLAAAAEYIVIMAYDQHNGHRPAGPVAAPNWVEDVLAYQLRYSDPHRTILGIPAYGFLWKPDAIASPRAIPLNRLSVGENTRLPDPAHGVDRIIRPDGSFFWSEADISAERIALVQKYHLAGVAVWRLGLDYRELWNQIGQHVGKGRALSAPN